MMYTMKPENWIRIDNIFKSIVKIAAVSIGARMLFIIIGRAIHLLGNE